MLAIKLMRRLIGDTKKKATTISKHACTSLKTQKKLITTSSLSSLSSLSCTTSYLKKSLKLFNKPKIHKYTSFTSVLSLNYKEFHSSPKPKWTTPDELSTSDLRRECERRKISSKGSRSMLIERLTKSLNESGGFDNGLTSDATLVAAKRDIETQLNRIPDKHNSIGYLYVEERFQKKLVEKYKKDSRISLHNDSNSHIKLDGKYADICNLRSEITNLVADMSSKETIYSLPHQIVLRLKRSILSDIRRNHDVTFTIMRHKHNGDDMMLIAIDGEPQNRMAACDTLEDVVSRIKNHSMDVTGFDSFDNDKNDNSSKKEDGFFGSNLITKQESKINPNNISGNVSDCFNVFNGVVLYLDPRMKEMMHDYQSRLDKIAQETNTNIYLGNRDLFWLNEFQLGIEGDKNNVANARSQIDQLMNQLKSLTMTIVLPPELNEDMIKESKQLATTIQKQLGVDTVIIQQNNHIYVHLIGTSIQVNAAACIIDSRSHRLNKIKGNDAERLQRRERIKTLNFIEYGVGGLDDTLKDMMRRTFESRLISPKLRSELDLQHVRGVLLYGPPGTGKTLIARKIAEILGCNKPKIVNGPEVESKWVGEAEKNIRNLFEEAQTEWDEKQENSSLHVIIFDEIDAIAKKRGGAHAKSRDGALNQLLCCMDGIDTLDNVLVFGLTNRKDCLDAALLRPGRLEVQLEIGLPDIQGREDILKIHTNKMRESGRLSDDVNLRVLAEYATDFSGADISGMVRSAVSFALDEMDDEDNVIITQELLQRGLHEVRFSKERLPSMEEEDDKYDGLMQA